MAEFDLYRRVNPTPKQIEFMEALTKYRYLLYGGARGGGKSYILRWVLIYRLIEAGKQGVKHARSGLFCEDYPSLHDRQVAKIEVEFPPELGKWNASRHEFKLGKDMGGGTLCLRNLDDPSRYQSAEFMDIAVDELTKNHVDVFNTLRGSMRWPGISWGAFMGATNPGGPGHLWVKRLFIDRLMPPEFEGLENEFGYVKALPQDNPHNSKAYIEELRRQPDKIRRAWLEGDWSVFEGQVFEEWRESVIDKEGKEHAVHVLKGFRAPPGWEWAGGMDFGHRKYGWLGIFASGRDGEIVCVDEFPFKEMYAEEAGYQAGLKLKMYPVMRYIAADEEMWFQTGIGPTKAEEFQRGLNRALGPMAPSLIKATHGRGSRAAGLELMHRYLAWKQAEDGTVPPWWAPKLRFTERCKYAISTISALPYDPNKPEDVDTDSEDHSYDACRYFLATRPIEATAWPEMRDQDTHPGLDKKGHRPWLDGEDPEKPDHFRMPRQFQEAEWQ